MTMQHKTSKTHQEHLESGLTVLWERFTGSGDNAWSVVCYSDDSRWLFDNGGAERLTLLGTVSDGLNKAEILESSIGAIIALYGEGPEAFESREAWIESMAESDKEEAWKMLSLDEQPTETQTVYTEVVITPCPSGFGEYQCGELSISPECSYACLQDLEYAGDLTPIDDALADPEFQTAGIEDIRGRIHNQPGRIYAKIEQDAFGVRVVYYGVEESEVAGDFFGDRPAGVTITYSTTADWGADGAWWEGAVDLDAEARACGFTSTPAVETIQLSDVPQLDDGEFCRLASEWGIARSNGWTSADVDQVIVAEINRRDVGDEHLIGYRAARLASESTAK